MTTDLTKFLTLFLTLAGLSGSSCVVGCASGERDQQIAMFQEVSLFAKEHGFAGQAHLNLSGAPSFDMRTGGVLDTGISGNVTLQFNSLAEPRGAATTAVGSMAEVDDSNSFPAAE